jgi:hypothetical protein
LIPAEKALLSSQINPQVVENWDSFRFGPSGVSLSDQRESKRG